MVGLYIVLSTTGVFLDIFLLLIPYLLSLHTGQCTSSALIQFLKRSKTCYVAQCVVIHLAEYATYSEVAGMVEISIRSRWFIMFSYHLCFNWISSLFLSSAEKWLLKSLRLYNTYFLLGTYTFVIIMFSWWIDLLITMKCPSLSLLMLSVWRPILSDINVAIPVFLCLLVAWYTFFHVFMLSPSGFSY